MESYKLRIGMIEYLNTLAFRHLPWHDSFEMKMCKPHGLGEAISQGLIDAGPVSLIEFHRLSDQLQWVNPFGISTPLKTDSVILVSHRNPERLDNAVIQLSEHSHTSNVLARVVLEQLLGVCDLRIKHGNDPDYEPRVVIGNEALVHVLNPENDDWHDLGAIWHEHTGLPFVFAIWACRKDWPESSRRLLAHNIESNLRTFDPIQRVEPEQIPTGIQLTSARRYLENFIWQLGNEEKVAISEFLNLYKQLPELTPVVDEPVVSEKKSIIPRTGKMGTTDSTTNPETGS